MCIDLQGKVALVTGASRGIGAAVARDMADHEAAVIINYLQSKDKAETLKNEIIGAGGKAIAVQADVRDRAAVDSMIAIAEKELGPIDILVNNANIDFPMQPFAEMAWPEIEAKLSGEIGAMVNCCQAVIPGMVQKKYGKIVLVSSVLSREPGQGFAAHCAAKAAMDSLARTMALELGPLNIYVNVVGTGLTKTDATAGMPPEVFSWTANNTPLRKVAEPQDIANAVMFLASDMADHITGQYIPVDGGGFMI